MPPPAAGAQMAQHLCSGIRGVLSNIEVQNEIS
jgi:hypothetical protein